MLTPLTANTPHLTSYPYLSGVKYGRQYLVCGWLDIKHVIPNLTPLPRAPRCSRTKPLTPCQVRARTLVCKIIPTVPLRVRRRRLLGWGLDKALGQKGHGRGRCYEKLTINQSTPRNLRPCIVTIVRSVGLVQGLTSRLNVLVHIPISA